jgi:cellulose synthase/poly-beta-1,6-N-acetylglucosamine synthase-like glycosyltransferase
MTVTFWLCLGFIAYVYVGYPFLLLVRARLRPWPVVLDFRDAAGAEPPAVSIVMAVHNEGRRLAARIDNLLGLDYPPTRRQIIVVSDGSTDDTPVVLRRYRASIDILEVARAGKAAALNAGVAAADHDLIVFTDARQAFAPDALAELTTPFRDRSVGAVSGELVLDCETPVGPDIDSTVGDGVGLYWRLEKQIRQLESAIDSTVGATGAIYALRRSLWTPLPHGTILDDVLAPMRCVLSGYRVVFNARARAFDRVAPDAETEGRRKTRTLAGNYQILALEPRLLLPWRNRVWAQYVSHKVGRLIVPYALVGLMITSAVLARRSIVYTTAFAAQCAFYLLAACAAWLDSRIALIARAARIAFTFVVMNCSAVMGLLAFLAGKEVWRES